MENILYSEDQIISNQLGNKVGDNYQIHSETSTVLANINKRLNEEDKTLRIYRRALAFSQILKKDLVPILLNSGEDFDVFDAVIRVLVNLTVPVECLCPENSNESESVKQTSFELKNSLFNTKEVFRDSRTTFMITDWMSRILGQEKMSSTEVMVVNNCLLLVRNILHIPDKPGQLSQQRCSHQNQILWNLFAQNLDKILLDLIKHRISNIWCTTVVQLISLVYKDQHVNTLQKLLQNFLESSLSESSEDNESNTSPQNGSGSGSSTPSTDDSSDQSRETSTPELSSSSCNSLSERRNSSGSLEVLPNNSPAPSESSLPDAKELVSPPPSPKYSASPDVIRTLNNMKRSFEESSEQKIDDEAEDKEQVTSGIDSEIMSTAESEPPHKFYIVENSNNGEKVFHGKSPKHKAEMQVFKARSPKHTTMFRVSGPQEKGGSGTDSSDISGVPKSNKHLQCKLPGSMTDSTDYGYVTWESRGQEQENQEQNSTSSNDDDVKRRNPRTNPVKPRAKKDAAIVSPSEKKEKRRSKLLKKSKENRMRVKAMVNHAPTDDDISELLKEFTVDFLHNGYASLVEQLLSNLSSNEPSWTTMDKSHFFWLLTYFLKFARQLEIGMDLIGGVLSIDTLSYITFEGVEQIETMDLANRERKPDLCQNLRRINLVVTALREFFQTVVAYRDENSCSLDKKHIDSLRLQTLYSKTCRQLLVYLLRRFNPQLQSLQYLTDLVICNHMLLSDLEMVSELEELQGPKFDWTDHIKQFTNAEMMRQFGRLLENYETNSPFVNDSVFTIMHHIAGDLDSPEALYIPSILKSFSKIWEQPSLQICEDWVDLIEFIIQKFIQNIGNTRNATNVVQNYLDYNETVDERGFTKEQVGQLFWHFTQLENSKDPVGAIIDAYKQTDNISLSRLSVIQALLSHGIITHAQYMSFIYMKNFMNQVKTNQGSVKAEVGSEHCNSDGHITDNEDPSDNTQDKTKNSEIQVLKDCLIRQGKESLIPWLQEVLLDACRVKMYPQTVVPANSVCPHEPIPYYYNKARQSIPLVPWNRIQYLGLQTEAFILLLHKLGFHLPADVGKVYPRIPHFWSADHIFTVALKIGPIDKNNLKFSQEELEKISKKNSDEAGKKLADKTILDEIEDVGTGFESMDLDLLNVSPSTKMTTETGSWLNLAMASKNQTTATGADQSERGVFNQSERSRDQRTETMETE